MAQTIALEGIISCSVFRFHELRHSHASMLIEMGFAPLEIADRLGHESVKTTLDTYSHLYPDKDQQLADRLNQFRRAVPPEEQDKLLKLQKYYGTGN